MSEHEQVGGRLSKLPEPTGRLSKRDLMRVIEARREERMEKYAAGTLRPEDYDQETLRIAGDLIDQTDDLRVSARVAMGLRSEMLEREKMAAEKPGPANITAIQIILEPPKEISNGHPGPAVQANGFRVHLEGNGSPMA